MGALPQNNVIRWPSARPLTSRRSAPAQLTLSEGQARQPPARIVLQASYESQEATMEGVVRLYASSITFEETYLICPRLAL